ncbi:hypothetical protein cce_1416 [Crocosphaera subtropica ATCC 51142]|uniref:Uncharacterized protein n=2 Tax=Crocosphaera TaxID=263510 RepID=B1WWP2_CROS5|nr:hypothetical protein cce_1416 [Crocosphaera subtropica ATCC 51142]
METSTFPTPTTILNGQAVLREGSSFLSNLTQTFSLTSKTQVQQNL